MAVWGATVGPTWLWPFWLCYSWS